jgi:hypothetical protein
LEARVWLEGVIFSYITYGILPHAKICLTDGVIFSWNGETLYIYIFIVLLSELMLDLQLGAGIPDLVFGGELSVWKGIFFLELAYGSLAHATKP